MRGSATRPCPQQRGRSLWWLLPAALAELGLDHLALGHLAAAQQALEEALPAAESVVIDSCGHVPQFEHPELTATLARDFITALPDLITQSA